MFPADRPPLADSIPWPCCDGGCEGYHPWASRIDELREHHTPMTMWCTIRTFAKHAVELGNEPVAAPIFFVKPAVASTRRPAAGLNTPGEVHHEVECMVPLNEGWNPWRSP